MKHAVLRLVMESFSKWLYQQFPPVGKPCVFDFKAHAEIIIGALPPDGGPDIVDAEKLDEGGVVKLYEWLFTRMLASYGTEIWAKIAIHTLWRYSFQSINWVLEDILDPDNKPIIPSNTHPVEGIHPLQVSPEENPSTE